MYRWYTLKDSNGYRSIIALCVTCFMHFDFNSVVLDLVVKVLRHTLVHSLVALLHLRNLQYSHAYEITKKSGASCIYILTVRTQSVNLRDMYVIWTSFSREYGISGSSKFK